MHILRRWTFIALAFQLVIGCVSPRSGIKRQEKLVNESISQDLLEIEHLKDEKIRWQEALSLMLDNNIDLLKNRDQVLVAEEALQQVYLDLIPTVSISAGVNKAITDLANLNRNDFLFSIFNFVNVPALLSLRIQYYTRTLELIRARCAYEMKVREQTIALYEQFLQYQLLEDRIKNLKFSSRFQPSIGLLGNLDMSPEGLQKDELALNLEQQSRGMQAAISRLFGSSRSRWVLDADTLPQWDYVKKPLPVDDPENFGTLYRQLQAIQLEGQRISKLGVKLNYWPDLRVSLSTPAVYAVSNGRSESMDFDRVLISLSTSVPLDTRLSVWRRSKQLERRIALDRRQLEQENAILVQRLQINQDAIELIAKQIRLNEIRIKFFGKQEPSIDPQKNREQLEKSISLSEQRTTLLIERARLEASFWLLDERRWERVAWEEPEKKVKKR